MSQFGEGPGSRARCPWDSAVCVGLVTAVGVLLALGVPCAQAGKPIVAHPESDMEVIPRDTRVIVVPPLLQIERVENESVVPMGDAEHEAFASILLGAGLDALRARRLETIAPHEQSPSVTEIADGLEDMAYRVARGALNAEARQIIETCGALDPRFAVLVQQMKIKEGPGGFWNGNTGTIGSGTSSTQVQVALIACSTGRVLWKNEVLVRKRVRPTSSELQQGLMALYDPFVSVKEKKNAH